MQKLAQLCIRRPVFATMLVLALVVMGLNSYQKLGVDFFPKVEFPIIMVTTTLRGAAPEEVESQLTKPIEEAVNTVSGIDELTSTSAEGISIVSIQFVLEKDPDVGAQEVRDKISGILGQLPVDADPPVVEKLATDASPVINVVASSTSRDLREITKIVDDRVKKNIESTAGVGQVRFVGERKRQVQVWLDGDSLYSYNLNIDTVRRALAAQNIEIPGGRVDQGSRELTLRTMGRMQKPQDFERIIVGSVNGRPIRVSDIAQVVDGVEEPRSLARLDGNPAVVLEVRKQSGTNTLDVIAAVKAKIDSLRATLPADLKLEYTQDQSTFIQASFESVQEHLLLGGFFAGLIVLLFMRSWRSTLIAAVAIPTSIISTYTLMRAMDFTLNQITMLALVLVVGVVIDDAIVVLENIFRFMEEKGLSPVEAAIQGTRDIGLAVMATTFSLVIIFLPVAMMPGIVGRFMSSFGFTAAFAIMVSLLVSFTLTPMMCSRFLKLGNGGRGHDSKQTFFYRILAAPYRSMLAWSMRHRWVIVAVSVLVMLSSAPLFLMVGKDFLPEDDQSEFEVNVKMPLGSSLEGTDNMMRRIETDLRELPGVKLLLTRIGSDIQRQVDRGSVFVSLVDVKERKLKQDEIMSMAREKLLKYRDVRVNVSRPSLISGAPSVGFTYFVQGPDLDRLDTYGKAIRKKLSELGGVVDLDTSYEPGKPELAVHINRDKASDLNVNVASVASALRTLVGGDDQVTTYKEGDDRYDVLLRVKKEFRDSAASLERLYVPSVTLGNVPVSSVAEIQPSTGPASIQRFNRQRQVLITANIAPGQSLDNAINAANSAVAELNLPPGYASGTIGRTREFGRAASAYITAFLLSILFMYMILASQYESFIDPITILISLPLSVPFALISLVLMHENFSIVYTSLGILMLFGIVKKNAILQIDHIKALRREGEQRLQAIMEGCEDRLRPILMTTLSLVAGMTPLALGGGAGSGSRRTVAIVVIGGQTLALALTLLVTPVAYSLFDDLAHARLWGWMAGCLTNSGASLRRAWAGIFGLIR